ncbi:X-box-binding protein 1-like [Tachypleus tridentatus]|uniref:X-box-binding protein 1-like n=1 Tax=Tachypleus tridentatus TaxID=6853 RepID=UPI003FD5D0ED
MAVVIADAVGQIAPKVLKKSSHVITSPNISALSSLGLCCSVTTLPGTSVSKNEITLETEVVLGQDSEEKSQSAVDVTVKKRDRLDHLTLEQKIKRRKLQNRVAAQSARDRKKAKLDKLELHVKVLEEEKLSLLSENEILKRKLMLLENENSDLRSRLGLKEIKVEQENEFDHLPDLLLQQLHEELLQCNSES